MSEQSFDSNQPSVDSDQPSAEDNVSVGQIQITVTPQDKGSEAPSVIKGMSRSICCGAMSRPKKKNGFRCCLATTYYSSIYPLFSCGIGFYIGFCGHDRIIDPPIIIDRFGSVENLPKLSPRDYPFCGGCNLSVVDESPAIELPCCIACLIWPVVFPFVWSMSYVSNTCSAGFGFLDKYMKCCFGINFCFCCCSCCIGNDADGDTIDTDNMDDIPSCFNCCGKQYPSEQKFISMFCGGACENDQS